MSWESVACLCVMVVGVVLFLYGSNYYDAIIGWIGVGAVIIGFSALIILKMLKMLKKRC